MTSSGNRTNHARRHPSANEMVFRDMAAPLPALVGCNQKDAENNSVGILESVSESQIRKIIALAMGLQWACTCACRTACPRARFLIKLYQQDIELFKYNCLKSPKVSAQPS